jgi:hypothetical protein
MRDPYSARRRSGSPPSRSWSPIRLHARPRRGTATANPTRMTTSCTRLTQAELSRPPATKYEMVTRAPIAHPARTEKPPATLSTAATPRSCAARMVNVPSQISTAAMARTARPYRLSRKSPSVRSPCVVASRHIRGPMEKARINDPSPADPFHHQALSPSAYPSDVAPTVELAPILAARMSKRSGRRRSLDGDKEVGAFARRPIHRPNAMKSAAYAMRRYERDRQLLEIASGRISRNTGRGTYGANDRVRTSHQRPGHRADSHRAFRCACRSRA